MRSSRTVLYLFFFFFQAEDGIRDSSVTGVQTCALPISPMDCFLVVLEHANRQRLDAARNEEAIHGREAGARGALNEIDLFRSEERRVGKECRSRWSPYH